MSNERVLVIPEDAIAHVGAFEGFERDVDPYMDLVLGNGHHQFRPRYEVETDPSVKQLIPYCRFAVFVASPTWLR